MSDRRASQESPTTRTGAGIIQEILFTDIEGSTQLWESEPRAMRPALERHDVLARGAIEANGGYVVKTTGDGVHAAFDRAGDGL